MTAPPRSDRPPGHEGIVLRCPALEDRLEFKGPRLGHHLPVGMAGHDLPRILKVRMVIGPKEKSAARHRAARGSMEEVRLHDPVLVVTGFGPRIREEYEDIPRRGSRRQGVEEEAGLRMDKMEVSELGAVALPGGTRDPLAHDVDAEAEPVRMGLGISSQKMAMTASDLPDKGRARGEDTIEQMGEIGAPGLHPRAILGSAGRILRRTQGNVAHAEAAPLPASMLTSKTLMSAGLTPLIRLACPSVRGRISDSFKALSLRNPLIFK